MPQMQLLVLAAILLVAPRWTVASDSVSVRFYLLQVEKWEAKDLANDFKSAVASGIGTYCASNLAACGMTAATNRNFTAADVYFSSGYPKNFNAHYMDLSLFIDGRTINLTVADVKAILANQRPEVYSRIGYYIVYIDQDFYSIPPPNLANWILVPTFVIGTVILVIVAVALSHHHFEPHNPDAVRPMPKSAATDAQSQNAAADVQPLTTQSRPATVKVRLQSNAASPTAAVLLPGATNEGFEQSSNERELRQRSKTPGPGADDMMLTDAAEFDSAAGGEPATTE